MNESPYEGPKIPGANLRISEAQNLCKTISSNVLLGWKVSAVIPVGSFGYYFELRSFRLMDEPRLSNKMVDQNETCYNHQRVEAQSALLSITIEGSVYG